MVPLSIDNSLLGQPISDVVLASVIPGSVPVIEEIEGRVYIDWPTQWLSIQAESQQSLVDAVLFISNGNDYDQYTGALPKDLDFAMGRSTVRSVLGPPTRSGDVQIVPILGQMSAWDSWTLEDGTVLHCEYSFDEERVLKITRMLQEP